MKITQKFCRFFQAFPKPDFGRVKIAFIDISILLVAVCFLPAVVQSSPVPRSKIPSKTLDVLDVKPLTVEERLLAVSIQGLVNRSRPKIYLLMNQNDSFWLDLLKQRKLVTETRIIKDIQELAKSYRSFLNGAVVPDPKLVATINIATMIAGVRGFAICTPEQAQAIGLPIKSDLRGRWKNSKEAYEWAFNNLHSEMTKSAVAWACPSEVFHAERDYFIQHKIWCVWISGPNEAKLPGSNIEQEKRFVEKLFNALPANIPIFGFPFYGQDLGIGEMGGTAIASAYAKYNIATALSSNLSVHSGYPPPVLKQKKLPAYKFDKSKVYLTFTISDGDNLQALQEWTFNLWRENERGSIPIAWTVGPTAPLLIPEIMRYYYSTASPVDRFVCDQSGAGYIYPAVYGSKYNRPAIFPAYARLTGELCESMDIHVLGVHDYLGTWTSHYRVFAENWPRLGAIFADYTKRAGIKYSSSRYRLARGNKPSVILIHASVGFPPKTDAENAIETMVREIREATSIRPAFLNCFAINWFYSPSMLIEVMKRLGPEYVAVPPETLVAFSSRYTLQAAQEENLALSAVASSQDDIGISENPRLTEIENDRYSCDGNMNTYWDKEDNKRLYILQLRLARPSRVARIVIYGFKHEDYAPKSFDILLNGRRVKRVNNLRYLNNRAQITLKPAICRTITLRINEYYGGSPAIRELEVYSK